MSTHERPTAHGFTAPRVFSAEGARVGLVVCERCRVEIAGIGRARTPRREERDGEDDGRPAGEPREWRDGEDDGFDAEHYP